MSCPNCGKQTLMNVTREGDSPGFHCVECGYYGDGSYNATEELTLKECKAIMEEYRELKSKIQTIDARIKMIEEFISTAENNLYYAKIQLTKLKEKIK